MTLSSPDPRKHVHTRIVESQGFQRDDGMWDIETTLRDTKTYEVPNEWRGPLSPGNPIHNMKVRLTIDDTFVVQKVEVSMVDTPFEICGNVGPAFQKLVGEKIGNGWNRLVRTKAGGTSGCTHISEIMRTIGTVAFQTVYPLVRMEEEAIHAKTRPSVLNSCTAFAENSPVVKKIFPNWYNKESKD